MTTTPLADHPVAPPPQQTRERPARDRWRRARMPLLVALLVVAIAVLAGLIQPRTSELPLAPDNPGDSGARAVAQILEARGVEVTYVRTSARALERAHAGSTLVITSTHLLSSTQTRDLAAIEADLVLLAPEDSATSTLTRDHMAIGWGGGSNPVQEAECEDPDARAAGTIRSDRPGVLSLTDDVTLCFPLGVGGSEDEGGYAIWQDGERRVTVIADPSILSNSRLTEEGHAALALRALGRHDALTWYAPSFDDAGDAGGGPPAATFLPAWTGPLALQLALVVLVLALWRGRALGRIVTEPLPVTVRAAETTLGRGRLYRRSRSRGHAAAALRAGTAHRAALRLGLPRTAGATEVIDALAGSTGRPAQEVADLLYGPPPTDDAGLVDLTGRLDQLESEVHRT